MLPHLTRLNKVVVLLVVVGVATALATAPSRPLSLSYLTWAALLGGVTTLLTRRLSPGWRSFWSALVIVGVLDEVAEYYYAAELARVAPFLNAGAIQAMVVGCTAFALGSVLLEAALGRANPPSAQTGTVPNDQLASTPPGSAAHQREVEQ
jgi:hypothetical protein